MSQPDPNLESSPSADTDDDVIRRFGGTPDEALSALMEVLASAGAIHAQRPNERDGAKLALHAMAWFMRGRGDPLASALFDKLACCLVDLDTGKADDLIKPVIYGNRPPDSIRKRMFVALALECVRRLCSMDQPFSVGEAQRTVARWLNDIPEFGDQKCTGRTLKNWQDKHKGDADFASLRLMFEATLRQAKSSGDVRRGIDALGKHHLK